MSGASLFIIQKDMGYAKERKKERKRKEKDPCQRAVQVHAERRIMDASWSMKKRK
jgi:hypothetical protein